MAQQAPGISGEARWRGGMGPRDEPEGDNWSGRLRWCDDRKGSRECRRLTPSKRHLFTGHSRDSTRRLRAKYAYGTRSEEHTSELQSLKRLSYAVFCLKKKNNKIIEQSLHLKVHISKRKIEC